jgi:hypothetical protein
VTIAVRRDAVTAFCVVGGEVTSPLLDSAL